MVVLGRVLCRVLSRVLGTEQGSDLAPGEGQVRGVSFVSRVLLPTERDS